MLHDLVRTQHDEIVARTRTRVAQRRAPRATEKELEHGVPLFLRQLAVFLDRADRPNDDIDTSATLHGAELLRMGFTIAQVVHDYGDVCQAVTELAHELNMAVSANEYRLLNLALDNAIAGAVTEFARLRELSISLKSTEDTGALAHEMRNFLANAAMAFDLMSAGQIAPRGSTASILKRSLDGMHQLVDQSLAEVRLQARTFERRPVRVAELIEELELTATVEAKSRGLQLSVPTVDYAIEVSADRPLLASAIANLLQNALKFTHPHSMVTLRATASAERVLIEVEDECGGLPGGESAELFRAFEQQATDRSGVGLGLAISKRAVEANGGTLSARDLPAKGCIFAIDLPRLQRPQ
jgi:signal transduction histidine kinase